MSQYYQNANVQLLQHPNKGNLLIGETEEDAMASIILGALQLHFGLEKEQIMHNPSAKKYFEANAFYAMRLEPMHLHWEQKKHLYDRDVVEFIDRLLQGQEFQKPTTSTVPQQQPVHSNTDAIIKVDKPDAHNDDLAAH